MTASTYTGGLRAMAVISGDRGRLGVARALVSSMPRTVISSRVAARVTRTQRGPRRCAMAPWAMFAEFCGPQSTVTVAINECGPAQVDAIVAKLPPGVDVVLGDDLVRGSVDGIEFGPTPPIMRCRARRRGWLR